MNQLDFLKERIIHVFNDLASEFSLPQNSFCITDNFSQAGTRTGKLISTELDIVEYAYPPDRHNSISKTSLILYIKPNPSFFELLIRHDHFQKLPQPATAQVKNVSDKLYTHLLFAFDDVSILEYISANTRYCLSSYSSSNTFGCCSRYKECSDQKQCVHVNKLYAYGCQYRKNLESQNIFY